jgi:hypothetical protein
MREEREGREGVQSMLYLYCFLLHEIIILTYMPLVYQEEVSEQPSSTALYALTCVVGNVTL